MWEQTEEFAQLFVKAEMRFEEIRKKLIARGLEYTYLGDLRFDSNGVPKAWLNSNVPLEERIKTPGKSRAAELALRYGTYNWWSLDALEDFISGKGPVMEATMLKLGYRKSKRGAGWAKAAKEEIASDFVGQRLWHEENDRVYDIPSAEEEIRLKKLAAAGNASPELDETCEIVAASNGLIYFELQVNPFESEPECLNARLKRRGHIAREQIGFSIEAKNILLEIGRMVYVKAKRDDGSFAESVWPTVIPFSQIYDLADELVLRARVMS
jgi:hypothetical protein